MHTILPETYRVWTSNHTGMYNYPSHICLGSPGYLYILDVSPEGGYGKLLDLKLHYLVNVTVL